MVIDVHSALSKFNSSATISLKLDIETHKGDHSLIRMTVRLCYIALFDCSPDSQDRLNPRQQSKSNYS